MTNHNRKLAAAGGILAFFGTLCLPWMLNLKEKGSLVISNSWFGVLFFAVCWFLLYRMADGIRKVWKEEKDRRGMAAAGVLALLFSLSLAFGVSLERTESVVFTDGMMWLSVLVWTVIFTQGIYLGWRKIEMFRQPADSIPEETEKGQPAGGVSIETGKEQLAGGTSIETGNGRPADSGGKRGFRRLTAVTRKWEAFPAKKRALLTVCFFLLCWLPVFLAVYPGFFVYDAQDEFIQVQTRCFTTHHPLPHVLLLGGIILAVHKLTGSYNAGIAVYTLLQMLFMAGVFTCMLSYMKKQKVKRYLRVLTALYFGFFPVIVMFTLCSAKDGIFTGALLLLLLSMRELAKQKQEFFHGVREPLFFCLSALVMICFRHNGMYALLVMTPILLFYMKGCRVKTGIMLGTVFAAYFLLTAGLTGLLGASDGENQEMLTVPVQQLARTYKYDGESLTDEQRETLYEILPEKALSFYTAKVSDGVKVWFDNEAYAADPGKYARLWLEIGLKHPFTYLNAWFMTSYGFWYPDTVIDVYRGNGVFTFTYEDSSFFGYEVEEPGVRQSRIPWLNEWYRKMSLEITQQKIPLLSMLFSPGFLFWVFAFTGGYALYRRKYDLLLPFSMVLLLWLTVILGPTYLPRYVLILWFILPGMAAVLVNRG